MAAAGRIHFGAAFSNNWRAVGLYVLGGLLILLTALENIFFLYVKQLKILLKISHIEVQLLSAAFLMGIFLILPFSWLFERFGFYGTVLVGFVTSESGLLLSALALKLPDIFRHYPVLVSLFQFMIAHGRSYLYYLTIQVTVSVTPKGHVGKAVGTVVTCVVLGQLVFTVLYNTAFSAPDSTAGFFFFGFWTTATGTLLYVVFYALANFSIKPLASLSTKPEEKHITARQLNNGDSREYGSNDISAFASGENMHREEVSLERKIKDKQDKGEITDWVTADRSKSREVKSCYCLSVNKYKDSDTNNKGDVTSDLYCNQSKSDQSGEPTHNNSVECSQTARDRSEKMSLKELFRNVRFHLFLWSGVIILSESFLYMNNITLVLQCVNRNSSSNHMVLLNLTVTLVFRFASGVLYDTLKCESYRVAMLLLASVCNSVSYILTALWMNLFPVLILSIVLNGISLGVSFSTYLSHCANLNGSQNKSMIQVSLLTTVAVYIFVCSILTGLVYDSAAKLNGFYKDNFVCYGQPCYQWSYLTLGLIGLLGIVLLSALCCCVNSKRVCEENFEPKNDSMISLWRQRLAPFLAQIRK